MYPANMKCFEVEAWYKWYAKYRQQKISSKVDMHLHHTQKMTNGVGESIQGW